MVLRLGGALCTNSIGERAAPQRDRVGGRVLGLPTREYISSGAQMLAKVEGGTTTYYDADHLSVRLMTDGTPGSPSYGQTVGQRGLYPFGDSLVWYETGTTDKWKFTTYERDGESLNDYAMARSYINRFGRFASPDPIAGSVSDPQSLNRYAYVRNDPIDAIDPDGRRRTLTPPDPCGHIQPPFGTPSTFPAYDPFWIWDFLPSWFPGNNPDAIWQFINPFLPPGTAYYDPNSPETLANNARNCPSVPEHPRFASVNDNIRAVQDAKGFGIIPPLRGWYNNVDTGGPWDYKEIKTLNDLGQLDKKSPYEDFGNFNYGATAAAMGIPLNVALRAAGWKQSNPEKEWGHWYSLRPPYGDDPDDQPQIRAGYQYYENGCYK